MAKKKQAKKRRSGKKTEAAIDELLAVLRDDPKLLRTLLLEPKKLAGKLKSKQAKALLAGADPRRFLHALLSPDGGPPSCPAGSSTKPSCPAGSNPSCPAGSSTQP